MTTIDQVQAGGIAATLGIEFAQEEFDLTDFWSGVNVEFEHGTRSPETDVTHDDPVVTGKIALAHLREYPDYYRRLQRMEAEAEAAQALDLDPDLGIV